MSARNIFRVIPSGDSWKVSQNGEVLSRHEAKENALKQAYLLAKKRISSRVIVYRPDGSIQESPLN